MKNLKSKKTVFYITAEADPSALPRIFNTLASLNFVPTQITYKRKKEHQINVEIYLEGIEPKEKISLLTRFQRMIAVSEVSCDEVKKIKRKGLGFQMKI